MTPSEMKSRMLDRGRPVRCPQCGGAVTREPVVRSVLAVDHRGVRCSCLICDWARDVVETANGNAILLRIGRPRELQRGAYCHRSHARKPATPSEPCEVDGCDKPTVGYGMCAMHCERWRKAGKPVRHAFIAAGAPRATQWASRDDAAN